MDDLVGEHDPGLIFLFHARVSGGFRDEDRIRSGCTLGAQLFEGGAGSRAAPHGQVAERGAEGHLGGDTLWERKGRIDRRRLN
jgi:hypothetical protein